MVAPPVLLLVEDDTSIRTALTIAFEDAGFQVVDVADGTAALDAAERWKPRVAVVDVRLPEDGPDGLQVTRELGLRDIPVILLTAADAEADRLAGFDAGADDYVVKPFGVPELLARIRAVLRRTEQRDPALVDLGGGLVLDIEARRVTGDGAEIALTRTEHDLLVLLVRNRGRVVTRGELLDRVWGYDTYNDNVIEVHLSSLRRKLGDRHRSLIQTVRGVGYRIDP